MIPKIIHYCWFGNKEKPKKVQECINSWYLKLPDYQIIEWNETNFDINILKYTKDAYEAGKYAFVSDVARVKALYEIGGIYLDTDVMVYKDFDEILCHKCVLGFEQDYYVATSFMACQKGFILMKDFYDLYINHMFYDDNGNIISGTNVTKLTNLLLKKGLIKNNEYQILDNNIVIYPQEYFSPYDYGYCIRKNTDNTICEHLFLVSWLPWHVKVKKIIKKILVKLIGNKNSEKLFYKKEK
ncbi:glycosyltransferase family 32 protein [Thomasclavelia cocleata]|uniref:glycosyltransferase family 32 protein n=1 Tax=Thomasclavelia cocleata TaxID=69824 RepID=UPI00258F33FE|nr:glycosyltransferase [Thomasclavelia cocleata]